MSEVRTLMLQRAANLASSVQCEEAWHIVNLYQKSHSHHFLQIVHSLLASYLNLSHDYFNENSWPPASNLLLAGNDDEEADLSAEEDMYMSVMDLPKIADVCFNTNIAQNSGTKLSKQKKFKLLQNQPLLPSFYKIPSDVNSTSSEDSASLEASASFHPAYRILQSPLPGMRLGQSTRKQPESLPFSRKIDPSNVICRYILDYLLQTPHIFKVEGLFRRSGNQNRITELNQTLQNIILTHTYHKMYEPNPSNAVEEKSFLEELEEPKTRTKRFMVYQELNKYSPHDVTSLLMKTLAKCCQGSRSKLNEHHPLVSPQISQLLFMATQLQYDLRDPILGPNEDWMQILCHARQLLTYRIVIQLLMPKPERRIFLKFLELFRRIDAHRSSSKMCAESLATCVVVAMFGAPDSVAERDQLWSQMAEQHDDVSTLKLRIDTLTNLIQGVQELNNLPGVVYRAIKTHLRSKLGHSPVQKCSRQFDENCSFIALANEEKMKIKPSSVYRSTSINGCKNQSTIAVKFADEFNVPLSHAKKGKLSDRTNTASSRIRDAFTGWRKLKFPIKTEKMSNLRKVKSSMVINK